jgi:carboxynorspermidine decarboxylase
MCEQNSDVLERTLRVVEEKFGTYMHAMKWINFGGGHHITREDYDIETLVRCIQHVTDTFHVKVYLEPGEAVALNAGYLVSSVLELGENGMQLAILDTSAACHMPDVIEMPYRPNIIESGKAGEYAYTYRLGGPTCLAGDVIGDYSFPEPLKVGAKLVFCDMAIYSMVKNNTFNGINLPSIYLNTLKNEIKLIRQFGYEDFKHRLS